MSDAEFKIFNPCAALAWIFGLSNLSCSEHKGHTGPHRTTITVSGQDEQALNEEFVITWGAES